MTTIKTIIAAILSSFLLCQCTPIVDSQTTNNSDSYLGGYTNHLNKDGSFRKKGYWDDAGITGKAQIHISLDEQLAYFYKGGQLVGISPVSSGMGSHSTPTGNFRISQKKKDHASTLYGVIVKKDTDELVNGDADTRIHKPGPGEIYKGAPMPYFMRFNGAVGMHTGFTPGYPASHGCVRLPDHMAKVFFANAPIGTEVKVTH